MFNRRRFVEYQFPTVPGLGLLAGTLGATPKKKGPPMRDYSGNSA
ncbi:MAG: hypothetical protein U5J83_19445 [Bryobacterales bacterium]|nr:hypothetical protein [Bryobacterales bacterium]